MIKIFNKLFVDNKAKNVSPNNLSFTGRRDDHNNVAILKNDKRALNVPVQRRIQESLTRLSKDGSDENIEFLLDVAENLQYGVKPSSKLNKAVQGSFSYNYLNIQKDSWNDLLKSSIKEALEHNKSESKEVLEAKFNQVFPEKEEIVFTVAPSSVGIVSPSIKSEEQAILDLRDQLLSNKLLSTKKTDKTPKNLNKHVADIKANLDKFVVSPEASLTEKIECLKELNFFLSPEYKIDPQLKDRKPQVLSEILNDIAGHSKNMSQKHHGSCAAVSIARKYMAAEFKPEFVRTVMSEVDNKPYMEIFNIYDFSKKVKTSKTPVDYDVALKKTYRVIDASVLNWMNIADTYGEGTKSGQNFSAFDVENYELFHDGHYLKNLKGEAAETQFYLRGVTKLNDTVKAISKMKEESTEHLDEFTVLEKTNKQINAHSISTATKILSKLGIKGSNLHSMTEAVLNPSKVTNPDFKISRDDEEALKKKKIENVILAKYPELKNEESFSKASDDLLSVFNLKAESNRQYKDLSKKVKLSGNDSEMENEFKNGDYKHSLFEMEAYNRVAHDFELDIPERVIYFRNQYNLPRLTDSLNYVIEKSIEKYSKPVEGDDSIEDQQLVLDQMDSIQQTINVAMPNQVNAISLLLGASELSGLKFLVKDYTDLLTEDVNMMPEAKTKYANILNIDGKKDIINTFSQIAKKAQTQPTEEGILDVIRPLGIETKQDLYLNYLDHISLKINKDQTFADSFSQYLTTSLGEEVSVPTAKLIVKDMIAAANDINKQLDSYAAFLQLPEDGDLIMKEFERRGEIVSAEKLDKLFDKYNKEYEYKENKTLANHNILMNNKRLSEEFTLASAELDDYMGTIPEHSFASEQISKLNDNFKKVAEQLRGADITKIEKTFRQINTNISDVKKHEFVKDKSVIALLDKITDELEDKVVYPPEELGKDYSDFYKRAEDRFPAIRRYAKRDQAKFFKQLQPKIEELYSVTGDYSYHFWIRPESHSGLDSTQQIRLLSQLTGQDYFLQTNLTKGTEQIKNGRNSGIDSVSVSHDEPALHAMYVYDVDKAKTVDEKGNIKEQDVILHDNSWGIKELNGARVDVAGNLRTDYSRDFGEKGGYYLKDGNLIGASVTDFETGQYKYDDKYNKYSDYRARVFDSYILPGKDKSARTTVASLLFDLIDLTHSRDPEDINFLLYKGILPTNKDMPEIVQFVLLEKFNNALNKAQQSEKEVDVKASLKKEVVHFLDNSADVYKSNGYYPIAKALNGFVANIPADFDVKNKESVEKLKKDFKTLVDDVYPKNTKVKPDYKSVANGTYSKGSHVKPLINPKKYEHFSQLAQSYENELFKFVGLKKVDQFLPKDNFDKLTSARLLMSKDKFERLPATHPLKVILNNMSFMSGKVSEKAAYYLYTLYESPEAHVKAKEINLTYRKQQILELLNKTPSTKAKPRLVVRYEDLLKISDSDVVINWIDKKYDPASNNELVAVYNKLVKMDDDAVKKLINESTENELGISYTDPYKLLQNVQNDDRHEEVFSSAIYNYAAAQNVLTKKDKQTNLNLMRDFDKWATEGAGSKLSMDRQAINFNMRVLDKSENSLDDVYKNLSIEFENINIEKFVKAQKEQAQRMYGVFPATPNLKVYTDNEIQVAIAHDLTGILIATQAIKNDRAKGDDASPKAQAEFRKDYEHLTKEFIATHVQPKYQAKAADLLNIEMKKVINSEIKEGYSIDDNFINFLTEKHISKDLSGLLEHMVKTVPKMDLLKSDLNNQIFELWASTLKAGYKTAKLNSIELFLKKIEGDDKGANAAQIAKAYSEIQTKSLKKGVTFEDFITGYMSESMFDPMNNNHTLRMLYSKFGLVSKSVDYIVNEDRLTKVVEDINKSYGAFSFEDKSTKNVQDAVKIYLKIKLESNRMSLLQILLPELPKDSEQAKKIKSFVKLSNVYSKEVGKMTPKVKSFVEANSQFRLQ